MRDDTRQRTESARADGMENLAEFVLSLEELLRRGARDLIQRAVEAELAGLLEDFADVRLLEGRRAVLSAASSPDHPARPSLGDSKPKRPAGRVVAHRPGV